MVSEVRGFFECTQYENDQPFDQWVEEFEDSMLANFGEIDDRRKKAIKIVKTQEMADKRIQTLLATTNASINAIGRKRPVWGSREKICIKPKQ